MKSLHIFRFCGVVSVIILWSFIGLAMIRAGLSFFDMRPLSYLGTDTRSNFLFSSGLILSSITTTAFGYYLVKILGASRSFFVAVVLSQICQVIAAIVPFSAVSSTRLIHTFAAFGLAIATPVFMYLFARSQTGELRKVSFRFAYLEILLFIIGIGGFTTTTDYAPIFQFSVAIIFHAWLVYFSLKIVALPATTE